MSEGLRYAQIVEAAQLYKCLAQRPVFADGFALTKTQDTAIHMLRVFGELSMGELAKRMGIPKEQASRVISGLAERGLVARRHADDNKRMVLVSFTSAGEEFVQQRSLAYCEQLEQNLSQLSAQEREELLSCSQRASELIVKALGSSTVEGMLGQEDCKPNLPEEQG